MKVSELIAKLQECDPEKPVCFDVDNSTELWFDAGQPEFATVSEDDYLVLLDVD